MAASMQSGKRAAGGFTYLGVLLLIALMGMALAATGELWSSVAKRQKEQELLWVGTQYAQALRSYYRSSPGLAQYPKALEDLLMDERFPEPRRHLRRLYADPLSNSDDWGLVRSLDGRITGVYSRAAGTPRKQAGFPAEWADFQGMPSYKDWQFVAESAFAEGTRNAPATGAGK